MFVLILSSNIFCHACEQFSSDSKSVLYVYKYGFETFS
jgi:hypothetical protein